MNTNTRIVLVAGLIVACAFLTPAFADDARYNRASLHGIKGIYVSVEKLDPEIERAGLTIKQIRSDVDAKLRGAGIKVMPREAWFEAPGSPYLYVNANVLKLRETGEYLYSIRIAFKQNVYLVRDAVEVLGATTWSAGNIIGITGKVNKIRDSIKNRVDEFINAYLSMNQR